MDPDDAETAGQSGMGGQEAQDERELVASFECEDSWYTAVDEENVYYTCREAQGGEFSSKKIFVLRKLAKGETEPTELATSEQPLAFITSDADAHYIREYGDFDEQHNTWYGNIRRVIKGDTELAKFIGASANDLPSFQLQTDEYFVISEYSASGGGSGVVYVYRKSDAASIRLGKNTLPGAVSAMTLDGERLSWIVTGTSKIGQTLYSAPLLGGEVTKGKELPNLCYEFERAGDALIAYCRQQGEDAYDLARVSLDGDVEVLVRAATMSAYTHKFARDRVYWPGGDAAMPTLEAIGDDGVRAKRAFSSNWHLKALTEHYAYSVRSEGNTKVVERVPLTEVK